MLLSGQRGKIARDALKPSTLGARTIIALADQTVVNELTTTSERADC
jgi:hypothetical protein